MKRILATAALLAAFISQPLAAQEATATSASASQAGAASQSGAVSSIYLDQRSPGTVTQRYSGTNKIATTGQVNPPSMGSGHPCGVGVSIGGGIVGYGLAGGYTRSDDACLIGQLGYLSAGMRMVAARNPDACKALREDGAIPASSLCSEKEKRAVKARATKQPTVSTRSTTAVAYSNCSYDKAANKITMSTKFGSDSSVARSQCKASLGF